MDLSILSIHVYCAYVPSHCNLWFLVFQSNGTLTHPGHVTSIHLFLAYAALFRPGVSPYLPSDVTASCRLYCCCGWSLYNGFPGWLQLKRHSLSPGLAVPIWSTFATLFVEGPSLLVGMTNSRSHGRLSSYWTQCWRLSCLWSHMLAERGA
jgi:hypothetical protein